MIKLVMPDIQKFLTFVNGLSKRERLILYCAAAFLTVTIADRVVISPVVSEIRDINEKVRLKEAEIVRSMQFLANKERIISEIAAYESFLKKPAADEEGMTELLKEIENLATKNGVYVLNIRPAGIKTEGPAKKFSVSLDCESAMEDLVAFLHVIENSKQIYLIDKIQITPKTGEVSVIQSGMTISRVNIV